MTSLPTGTVTILFSDIEGSTRLLQQLGPLWKSVVETHLQLLRAVFAQHSGRVVSTEGDSCFVVFVRASEAIAAAAQAQRSLAFHAWPDEVQVRVRIGLHTGEPEIGGDNYVGMDVHRAARIAAVAHGGQIVLSPTTHELVQTALPPGLSLRDLGTHRLKDLAHPERLFQLDVAGLPTDFPPLKSINNRPHNLPAQPTALIGREKEVAAARDFLRRDEVRLLTLTGPGGTGKTRLSLQLAAEMLEHCDDGVFFVALAPLDDPNRVSTTIAQTLGLQDRGGQPMLETLKNYLGDKTMLLVLDNFEQIIEAAPDVGELLGACPRLKIVATSRIALHLRGEQEFPVPPLDLPAIGSTPDVETLRQYAAVTLFIQRAQAVKPDFLVTNENAPAVAEICARLDGLPLAIELAASRVRLLSPQAMLARLENRLKLLTGGARDLPARHQTLRGTIAWSYDLLDEDEKILFARLSVFVSGCTLEAAEAIGVDENGADVLDGVASLAGKSLLRQEESADFESRFFMLETIREYAAETLAAAGRDDEMRRRHAEYYMALAQASKRTFDACANAQKPLYSKQLEIENHNLWSALTWAAEHQPEWALHIILSWHCALHSAYLAELGPMVERAFENAAETDAPIALLSEVLGIAGDLAAWRGDFFHQGKLIERRLAMLRETAHLWPAETHIAWTLHGLGVSAAWLRDYESAVASHRASLDAFRQLKSNFGIGITLNVLGSSLGSLGEFEEERACYEEARAVFEEINNQEGVAGATAQLADLHRRQNDLAGARALVEEVARIEVEMGDLRDHPWRLYQLGELEMCEGDITAAGLHLRRGLRTFQNTNHEKAGWLQTLLALSHLATLENQWQRAARLVGAEETHREALRLPPEIEGQERYHRNLIAMRATLGEELFAICRSQGRAMNWKQTIEYALSDDAQNT